MAKTKSQVGRRARASRQADAERLNRLLIVGGVVAVVLIAIGVIAFGWWQTQIKPLGKTVLQVGQTTYSLGQLERRMRLTRDQRGISGGQVALQLPDITLQQLEIEGKLLEGAGQLKITATEEELAARIRQQGDLADDVEASVFANEFSNQVKQSGLKEGEYRQLLRADILQQKVLAYFVYLAPKEEPQARARWIVVDSRTSADEALRRLNAGEDFVTVGRDLSQDVAKAEGGGEDDWGIRGTFPDTKMEDFLFKANADERSDIISAGSSFYIVQLLERDDHRTLDDRQRQQVGQRELTKWLDSLDSKLTIKRALTQEDANRALNDIF